MTPGDEHDTDGRAAAAAGTGRHELRSFGRRRGRKPSAAQQRLLDETLPLVGVPAGAAPLEPASLFTSMTAPPLSIWLEIGFGGGEHLLWQARANPRIGIIGCEPFEAGIIKVLAAIEAERLTNIRLHAEDARHLLRRLSPGSIGRVFMLFPDPWPKRRHVRRRLASEATLGLIARAMAPGTELRLATDIADYARTMLLAVAACGAFEWQAREPADWRAQPVDWPKTRYQQKAEREGRRCYFLTFRRR